MMKMAPHFCDLLPQTPKPYSNRENINKTSIAEHYTIYLASIPQNGQGHHKQI